MDGLTDKQRRVFSYIQKTVERTGICPSQREIASHLGVTIRSAFQHVVALERKGAVKRQPGHRGINLKSQGLPILGKISAGKPMFAEENIEGRLDLKDITAGNEEELFLLRVNGDSMVERGVNPGDLVLIRQQSIVGNGEVAAVLIGDEATLKIFRSKERKIYLEPANKKYKPIYLDRSKEINILGKALMAFRFLERGRAL